jgi:hypothetical protein
MSHEESLPDNLPYTEERKAKDAEKGTQLICIIEDMFYKVALYTWISKY